MGGKKAKKLYEQQASCCCNQSGESFYPCLTKIAWERVPRQTQTRRQHLPWMHMQAVVPSRDDRRVPGAGLATVAPVKTALDTEVIRPWVQQDFLLPGNAKTFLLPPSNPLHLAGHPLLSSLQFPVHFSLTTGFVSKPSSPQVLLAPSRARPLSCQCQVKN